MERGVMRNSYVIGWKSRVNGRAGRGKKVFELVEAQRLADELNREYPSIDHQAVEAKPTAETPPDARLPEQTEPEKGILAAV